MSTETKSSFITKIIVGVIIGAVGTIVGTWIFAKFLAPKMKAAANNPEVATTK